LGLSEVGPVARFLDLPRPAREQCSGESFGQFSRPHCRKRLHENPQIVALSDLPTVSLCQVQKFHTSRKIAGKVRLYCARCRKGLARNPLIALRRLAGFVRFGRMCRSSLVENSTHSTRQNPRLARGSGSINTASCHASLLDIVQPGGRVRDALGGGSQIGGAEQTYHRQPWLSLVHIDIQVSKQDQQHHSHHNRSYYSQQPKTLAAREFLNEFSSPSFKRGIVRHWSRDP
jgi:hypothetical protein